MDKFYDYMARNPTGANPFAFKLQEYFLEKRFENEAPCDAKDGVLITDRFLLEYFEIFVKNLLKNGLLSQEGYEAYLVRYKEIGDKLKKPDVIVFLRSSVETNIQRINKRNREAESGKIDEGYLRSLHNIYEQFYELLKKEHADIKLIDIDTDDKSIEEVYETVESRLVQEFSEYIN